MACASALQKRRRERGCRPEMRSEWCANGHHKPTVGVMSKTNGCRACAREVQRASKRLKRSKLYGAPVELFGEREHGLDTLRVARESLGLTRPALEQLSGVSRNTITDIERGKSKGYPTTRKKLVDALAPLLAEKQRRLKEVYAA